jgi:hypothetical protein
VVSDHCGVDVLRGRVDLPAGPQGPRHRSGLTFANWISTAGPTWVGVAVLSLLVRALLSLETSSIDVGRPETRVCLFRYRDPG